MMIKTFLILICSISSFVCAKDEVPAVENLILSAQLNLDNLIYLKETILKYEQAQARYMQDSNDNEALYTMIKLAHTLLENIKTNQLSPLFEPSFLSELTIVSKPISKLGVPKP